jgi:hypothetical protein
MHCPPVPCIDRPRAFALQSSPDGAELSERRLAAATDRRGGLGGRPARGSGDAGRPPNLAGQPDAMLLSSRVAFLASTLATRHATATIDNRPIGLASYDVQTETPLWIASRRLPLKEP